MNKRGASRANVRQKSFSFQSSAANRFQEQGRPLFVRQPDSQTSDLFDFAKLKEMKNLQSIYLPSHSLREKQLSGAVLTEVSATRTKESLDFYLSLRMCRNDVRRDMVVQ